MEDSQSQSEPEKEMSFEQKISQTISRDGHLDSRSQTFVQGLFSKEGGSAFPRLRLVIVCLALLNTVLLIAAFVIGIYCAKAKDLEISHSATTPLIVELNYLRNQSDIIQAKLKAQRALVTERNNHLKLMLKVKQMKTITDGLQGKIETLKREKTNLQTNRTSLEGSCGRCLPGWILLNSSCYYFSSSNFNHKKNWPDSSTFCVSHGGDLIVINNLEEQELMSYNLPKQSSNNAFRFNGFWIGLTLREASWVWVNNVTETKTLYWKNGEPNNSNHQSQNCAAFGRNYDTRRTWFSANCFELRMNWICEREPK